MAVFRVERNTGYTVMSNHHLRNKELTLKAKGLLSQMLSLPEDWDYRRTLAKRAAREVTFSDLSESELAQLFTTDEYESDYYRFQVSGFDVLVKNELLAENRLLSACGTCRSTVNRPRQCSPTAPGWWPSYSPKQR